jgi:phage replication O-like protein O
MKDRKNNPQTEDGFVKIASELVDQLAFLHLSGNEWQIVWAVWRKTWGWQKKEDAISLTKLQELTGLSRPAIVLAIKRLVAKKVLVVKKQSFTNIYSFNKLYTEWTSSKKDTSSYFATRVVAKKQPKLVAKKQPKLVAKKQHTIDNIDNKDTITIDTINGLIKLFEKINPSYERLYANKTQRSALDRLVKKYGYEKMTNLLKNLPSITAKPYAPRITTPYELETKMGQLLIFLKQEGIKGKRGGVTKL